MKRQASSDCKFYPCCSVGCWKALDEDTSRKKCRAEEGEEAIDSRRTA